MSTSSMRQLLDLMDVPKSNWHREVSNALRSLITEAHVLTDLLTELERLDPRAGILMRAQLHGRLDEAGFGDMMGKLKSGVKSAVGKTVNAAQAVNTKMNTLGRLLQNTQPVQNFDQQVENLKSSAAQKYPKLASQLQQYGEFAKTHPKTQAFTIGVLTAIASLVGGPIGGAVASGLLRAGNELLKGEKASTAIGKTIKTASIGWLAGFGIHQLGAAVAHALVPAPVNFKTTIDKLAHVSWMWERNGRVLVNVHGMTSPQLGHTLDRAYNLFQKALQDGKDDLAGKYYKIFIDTSNQAFDPNGPIQQAIIADQAIDLSTKALLQKQSDMFAGTMKKLAGLVTAGVQGVMAGAPVAAQGKDDGSQPPQSGSQKPKPFIPPSPPIQAGAPAPANGKPRQPSNVSLARQVLKNLQGGGIDVGSADGGQKFKDQYNAAGGTWA